MKGAYRVVKLGGSLMRSPLLPRWLEVLVEHGGGRTVIVPGGGGFADAVRAAQSRCAFDDRSAHRLALLAMVQYGLRLTALEPRLWPAVEVIGIQNALYTGRVPVWLPVALLNDQTRVPASWDWSGDSIALWLAQQIHADLFLVKSVAPSKAVYTAECLQRAGIVDQVFPRLLRPCSQKVYWLGPEQPIRFPDPQAGALVTSDRADLNKLSSRPGQTPC